MFRKCFFIGALSFFISLPVAAQSVRDYMIRAIDSGEASGIVTDETSKMWQMQTQSKEPLKVYVTTVKKFKQEGCRRFSVVMGQSGVALKTGGQANVVLPFEMNICRDGTPPLEAVDMNDINRKIVAQQQEFARRRDQQTPLSK